MNRTLRMIGVLWHNAEILGRIRPRVRSRLPAAVIGILIASLVGCGGGRNNTNNQPLGPAITTSGLPNGAIGMPYQQTLVVTGGTPPYSWSLTSAANTLPSGLTLSGAGTIAGTPTTPETYSFAVQVTDSDSSSADASLSITITSSALAVSTTSLNFSTTTNQSFTVSGGVGPVTESSNCVQDGIANLGPPSSGALGAWNVSPLSNGVCSINFTDSSNATVSVNVSVDIQEEGTSTLTIQMEEDSDCNNATIWFRFFDETDALIWPATPNYFYFPYSSQVYSQTISCKTGAKICYGGSFYTNTEQPEYWGVGINNDESCPNCCYTCEAGTTPVNNLSCTSGSAARRRPDDLIGGKDGRLQEAPMARGPRSETGVSIPK